MTGTKKVNTKTTAVKIGAKEAKDKIAIPEIDFAGKRLADIPFSELEKVLTPEELEELESEMSVDMLDIFNDARELLDRRFLNTLAGMILMEARAEVKFSEENGKGLKDWIGQADELLKADLEEEMKEQAEFEKENSSWIDKEEFDDYQKFADALSPEELRGAMLVAKYFVFQDETIEETKQKFLAISKAKTAEELGEKLEELVTEIDFE